MHLHTHTYISCRRFSGVSVNKRFWKKETTRKIMYICIFLYCACQCHFSFRNQFFNCFRVGIINTLLSHPFPFNVGSSFCLLFCRRRRRYLVERLLSLSYPPLPEQHIFVVKFNQNKNKNIYVYNWIYTHTHIFTRFFFFFFWWIQRRSQTTVVHISQLKCKYRLLTFFFFLCNCLLFLFYLFIIFTY